MGEMGFESVCENEEDVEGGGGDLVFELGFHGELLPYRCGVWESSGRVDVVFD